MSISILGIFVADLVFFGEKIPVEGETILGKNFVIGPGAVSYTHLTLPTT